MCTLIFTSISMFWYRKKFSHQPKYSFNSRNWPVLMTAYPRLTLRLWMWQLLERDCWESISGLPSLGYVTVIYYNLQQFTLLWHLSTGGTYLLTNLDNSLLFGNFIIVHLFDEWLMFLVLILCGRGR